MNVRNHLNQYYFDMTVSDIRLLHRNTGISLSYNSMMYLDVIAYQPNCTVSMLAQTLAISKSAVTIKVNELVKQGLVIKTQDTQDKRVYHLNVSQDVAHLIKSYNRPFERAIQHIEEVYTPEQLQIFCDILQTFSHEFQNDIK